MITDSPRTRQDALLEVSESIASHESLPALFHALSPSLAKLVSFTGLGLVLHDPERGVSKLHVLESSSPYDIPDGYEFPAEQSPTSVVLETGQPFYFPDLELETRYPVLLQMLRNSGIRSYCILPLITERRKIGSLTFGSPDKNAYSGDDIVFLCQVARQVAVAVENTLNFEAAKALREELARDRDRLRLLLQVNNAIVARLETRPLFEAISGALRETLKVEFASLTLWDPETKQLRRQVLDIEGSYELSEADPLVPIEGTPSGTAYLGRKPVVITGEELATSPYSMMRSLTQHGFRSACAVPLICGDRVLGTLNVMSRGEEMTQDGVNLLVQVAGKIAIALDNAAAYRRIEELNARLAEEKLYLKEEIRTNYFFEEIVGRSAALTAVLRQVETVAPSDSTVLVCGETGTGKELIARAIHNLSSRHQYTFAKVNCAAIPTGLLESELFGHEKGAFTGAIEQRIGRFETAHRGTLFLDEVGDIPLELQPKLLRVLQEREFERLGSSRTIRVDVRLVAATNRDLLQMVDDRQFRADLYYRLNVFPIVVPPLRERVEDIPLLVSYFTEQYATRMGKQITTIPSGTMEHLVRYPWPGNIRELQNLIERAVIMSPGPVLNVPLEVLRATEQQALHSTGTLEEAERQHILRTLEETNWVLSGPNGAAAKLGLKRPTLQFRMKKLGISRPQ